MYETCLEHSVLAGSTDAIKDWGRAESIQNQPKMLPQANDERILESTEIRTATIEIHHTVHSHEFTR